MYEAPDYPGAVPAERQYDFDASGHRLRRRGQGGWRWKADPELGAGADPFKVEWLGRSTRCLKRPMLAVIAAEQDSWGPLAPELLDQRLSYIPELERAKVPGTGHFPHMEKPGPTAHLLLDYLQA